MTWWLVILNLVVLGAAIWQFSIYQPRIYLYRYFWASYFWKLLLGLTMGYVYGEFLGGGDTWTYYEDATSLAQIAVENPLGYFRTFFEKGINHQNLPGLITAEHPRALFMVKLLSLFALITEGNYIMMSAYLSTLSFMGMWLIATRIAQTFPESQQAAAWAFLFMPSIIFWSSGISKEAVFMGAWGLLLAFIWPHFKGWKKPRAGLILVLMLVVYLMFRLKYYYMAVILPVALASLLVHKLYPDDRYYIFVWTGIFLGVLLVASWLHPNLHPHRVMEVIRTNAQELALKSSPQSMIRYQDHPQALWWGIINLPKAFVAGLIRPFWNDWGGFWRNLAIIETTLLWVVGLGNLGIFGKIPFDLRKIFPLIIYITVLAALLALSTPNLGTLFRYKVVFMPVLVYLLLFRNPWWDRLKKFLP